MKNEIIDAFKTLGYSTAQIAGILGNIDVETGGSFDYQQKQRGAKRPAHGIFQLDPNGGKYQDYQKWLKNKKKKDSVLSQVEFFDDTIFGSSTSIPGAGNAQKIKKAFGTDNPSVIAQTVSDIWLRPQKGKEHNDRRVAAANTFYKEMKQPSVEVAQPKQQPPMAMAASDAAFDAGKKDLMNPLLVNEMMVAP